MKPEPKPIGVIPLILMLVIVTHAALFAGWWLLKWIGGGE